MITCSKVVSIGTTGHPLRCQKPVKWKVVNHHRVYDRFCPEHMGRKPLNKFDMYLKHDYKQLFSAEDVGHVICLSTLIAGKLLGTDATPQDATAKFESFGSCECCPMCNSCLLYALNE